MPNLIYFFLLVVVAACSDSQFQSSATSKSGQKKPASPEAVVAQNAPNAGDEDVGGAKKATFRYGPKTVPNDVLFIFDNSVSMDSHLQNVKKGFESLVGADWFGDVRFGVMTTLPADPKNLNKPHPGVSTYKGIESEPGFLSLVSMKALTEFKKVAAADKQLAYAEPLCEQEWFRPEDRNPNGKRCLSVALQNPFHAVVCEAGMTALSQLVDKRGQVFRKGAFAQVVFVSDAQDPGCRNAQLQQIRPKPEDLRKKMTDKNVLLDLKFHGVIPVEKGGTTNETKNESTFGYPYNTLVKQNKGILLDITASSDYSQFAKSLAKTSLPEPVFALSDVAKKITSVKVAGKELPAEKIQLSPDGKSVRLLGISPTEEVNIEILFSK